MHTRRSREGYLLIDNRVAPPAPGIPKFMEGATMTCPHCSTQMIRNPERVRERAYCRACDRDICDNCALIMKMTGSHKSLKQFMDEQDTLAHKQRIL